MTFPTKWIDGSAVTLKVGSTQYETEAAEVEEIVSSVGGVQITMADGSIYTTPQKTMVTGLRVTVVQGLSTSSFWRYLRETASTTATIVVTGSSSATPSASNPKWTYSATGWTRPALKFTPGGTDMVESIFTVSGNPVEATA